MKKMKMKKLIQLFEKIRKPKRRKKHTIIPNL